MQKGKFFMVLALAGSLGLTLLDSCSQAPKTDEAKVQDSVAVVSEAPKTGLAIDTLNSKITWIGTKPTGKHNGTFAIQQGILKVEGGKVTGGNIMIDMSRLVVLDLTDKAQNKDLTDHLKDGDFFDVPKFPTASFEITGTAPYTPDPNAQKEEGDLSIADANTTVTGNLTLKGVTKSISFPAKINVEGNQVTALANFNIDRTQWSINYKAEGSMPNKFIHNKVNIGFEIRTIAAQ